MGLLDALRALPRRAKKLAKAKYDEPGYGFSLLRFYSKERVPHKMAFTLSRLVLGLVGSLGFIDPLILVITIFIPKFGQVTLNHTFASLLLRRGVPRACQIALHAVYCARKGTVGWLRTLIDQLVD